MKYYNRNRSRGFSQIETNAIRQNASFFWSSAWFACRLPVVYQFFRYISGIFLFHLTVEFLLGGCFVGSWSTDFYPVSQRRRRRRTSHVVSRGATLTANPNQPDRTKIGVWQFQEFELIFGLVALILLIRKIFNNPWKLLKNSRKLPWKVPNSTGKILWNGRIYIWISFRWYLVGKSFKNCWNCLGKCKNLPNSTGKILFVGIWLENPWKMLKKWQILSWKMQKSTKIDQIWLVKSSKMVKNWKKNCLQNCENRQKCGRNVGRIAKFDFLVFVIDDSFVTWRAWRAFGSVCFPAEGVATPPRLSRSLLNPDHTQLLPHLIDFYVAFTTDRIIIKSDNQISCLLNSLRQRALRAILSEKFLFILFRPILMEIQRLPVDFQWFSTRNAVSFHEI